MKNDLPDKSVYWTPIVVLVSNVPPSGFGLARGSSRHTAELARWQPGSMPVIHVNVDAHPVGKNVGVVGRRHAELFSVGYVNGERHEGLSLETVTNVVGHPRCQDTAFYKREQDR